MCIQPQIQSRHATSALTYVEYLNNLISYLVMLFSVFYVSLKKTILLYLKIYCILLGSSRVLAPPPAPRQVFSGARAQPCHSISELPDRVSNFSYEFVFDARSNIIEFYSQNQYSVMNYVFILQI